MSNISFADSIERRDAERYAAERQAAEARVAKGAAWLDRVKPDWYTDIDVGSLRMAQGCSCILGQLVSRDDQGNRGYRRYEYHDVITILFATTWDAAYGTCVLDAHEDRRSDRWALDHGFNAPIEGGRRTIDERYRLLEEAWVAEIKARWGKG